MIQHVSRFLLSMALLCSLSLAAFAQHARISGTVVDPHNAVIANAEVQVINQDTVDKVIAKTDKAGSYQVQFLPAGRYQVTIQARGFSPAKSIDITLTDGQAVIHDVQLTIASVRSNVTVEAKEGSEEAGYVPETAKTTGPWGDKAILDTPYSISVTSSELMDNMIASSADKVILYSPVATPGPQTANYSGWSGLDLRGFPISEITRDGIPLPFTWLFSGTEDLDRVEILTGLSSFFYGAGNVGGVLDEVSKRPTKTPIADVSVGNFGGEQMFGHLDMGGPIGKSGKFGYRVNAFTTDGNTVMQGQAINRHILSGAFDWHPTKNLLIQVDGSWQKHHVDKPSMPLLIWGAAELPPASSLSNTNPYTYDWTYFDERADRIGTNATWDASSTLTLRGGYMYYTEDRSMKSDSIYQGAGVVYVDNIFNTPVNDINQGVYSYLDKKFKTFGLAHKLTLGMNYSGFNQSASKNYSSFLENDYATLSAALSAPQITWPTLGTEPSYVLAKAGYTNIMVGDEIAIGHRWSALVGVNRARVATESFNTSGLATASYDKASFTPSASILFKPISRVSTYATYMESLLPGTLVPTGATPPYTNQGTVLSPTMGRQIEVGAKAELGKVLLTAAFFDIDEGSTYNQDNADGTQTLTQDGREVHKGVEFTATGKVTRDLTIFGGATFFHARITKTNNTLMSGQIPTLVPEQKISMLAEYRLPFLKPLYLTGGVAYVGQEDYQPSTKNYLRWLPAYTVGDAGLRFEKKLDERKSLIGRVTVSNLTDLHYWQSGSLGAPRTVACSLTTKF
jgi:iron complex outermembrane receptor protein